MDADSIPKDVLRLTAPCKTKPGGPKRTLRTTVMDKTDKMNLTWGEAQYHAKE